LYQAALEGGMRDFQRLATHVRSLGEVYALFSARLSQLAEAYQSQALVRLLEQCREAARKRPCPGLQVTHSARATVPYVRLKSGTVR
jgi:hypothetical protein